MQMQLYLYACYILSLHNAYIILVTAYTVYTVTVHTILKLGLVVSPYPIFLRIYLLENKWIPELTLTLEPLFNVDAL